ncbi:hypothetical protein GCWU000321_01343 [Dialister invisus DSM 15470]|uniref:Uncharacterized protein n=1 Tax=Dialister invisus DSM 15470 TaxID=592028 RepID=C9LP66_9FIRM|nr:hypothetical protein GCWU000321_01343 [Dialister invisus DSM 15470]
MNNENFYSLNKQFFIKNDLFTSYKQFIYPKNCFLNKYFTFSF